MADLQGAPRGRRQPDADDPISRAGLKLEAALERFSLRDRVRDAIAVDVGSSTGGFTACLLRYGARSVTAVDVGHKQLHPSLRGDPRVRSAEGVDWKTLALAELPGPFTFFSVDVSFVAARSMLRSLAFRLGPGAEGVVLIKPQFELPDRRVREGKVDDPNLRRDAVERFSGKAVALGFQVVSVIDSPIAGGSGTIELLAHLRFGGRPDILPRPGEKRPARPPRTPRAPARSETLRWFAVSAPGLEGVTESELSRLPGVAKLERLEGGVEWSGALEVGLRANLWLRTATRVVARVGQVRAREFGKLRRLAAGLPWELFLPAGAPIKISATTSRCRLYHTGALAETFEAAIGDRLRGKRKGESLAAEAGGAPITVMIRGLDDMFAVSIDSSGDRLHRRGWRLETAQAPLRETLAAGLLALCEWDGSTALMDPMCGAGTIPLEACAQALNVAPGGDRPFALQQWPLFADGATDGDQLLARLRSEARQGAGGVLPAPIAGSDRNAEAIASARQNAERAGFAAHVSLTCADIGDVRPIAETGLVLLNPPYGRRLGNERSIGRLYRDIGRILRTHFHGWRVGLVVANRAAAETVGLPVEASFKLTNGGIPITLLRYSIP